MPGLLVSVGCDESPLPIAPPALFPDPATGGGLAVAGRPHEQHAAFGSPAINFNAPQISRIQVANRVFPKDISLVALQHRRFTRRLEITATAQRRLVQPAVV